MNLLNLADPSSHLSPLNPANPSNPIHLLKHETVVPNQDGLLVVAGFIAIVLLVIAGCTLFTHWRDR